MQCDQFYISNSTTSVWIKFYIRKQKKIETYHIIIASIIIISAFLIRGLTGFGSGLIMVPFMALFLDIKLVASIAVVLAVPSGIILISTFQTKKWINRDVLPMMVGGAIVGTVIGTYIIASYKSELLKILLGIFLCVYSVKMLFWNNPNIKQPNKYWGILAGFLGGGLGGLFSTGGPPVVVYLNGITKDKRVFRSTLTMYFLVINTWQLISYIYCGLVTANVLKSSLYLLPAFVIGNILGSLIHIKIDDKLFNRIVAIILLVTGITMFF